MGLLFDLFLDNNNPKDQKTKENNKEPGIHDDWEELERKRQIKEGKYDSFNFEEEDLEEEDYHYEDAK